MVTNGMTRIEQETMESIISINKSLKELVNIQSKQVYPNTCVISTYLQNAITWLNELGYDDETIAIEIGLPKEMLMKIKED